MGNLSGFSDDDGGNPISLTGSAPISLLLRETWLHPGRWGDPIRAESQRRRGPEGMCLHLSPPPRQQVLSERPSQLRPLPVLTFPFTSPCFFLSFPDFKSMSVHCREFVQHKGKLTSSRISFLQLTTKNIFMGFPFSPFPPALVLCTCLAYNFFLAPITLPG